jgi:hypothetical protein
MRYEFPEHLHQPSAATKARFEFSVNKGREVAAGASIVVCALARDLGSRVERFRDQVAQIVQPFQRHAVVIIENDSIDDTAQRLQAWAAEDPVVNLTTLKLAKRKWGAVRDSERGNDMASYRNRFHDVVARKYADYPFTLVVDSDLAGISPIGILHSLGLQIGWDAIASCGIATVRGRVVQYDAWAWRDIGHWRPHSASEVNPRLFNRGDPPFVVASAFGGAAIYRTSAFLAGRYSGGDIEHVGLHKSLQTAGVGRIWVNPGQVTRYD